MQKESNFYPMSSRVSKWTKLFIVMLSWGAMSVCGGCAARPVNRSVVCRIRFDMKDKAIEKLNEQNLRALLNFREVCP